MQEELLSVVIPVYNVERYLRRCLDSVLGQTYQNMEIILVDDGSTDGSGLICDEYKEKDGRIQVIHKENCGLVSARQAGTMLAIGSYITQVDSDDWIEPQMYEELMQLAFLHNADVVTSGAIKDYGNHCVCEDEMISSGVYRGEEIENKILPKMIATDYFYAAFISPHVWNKIYRTELYKAYQMQVSQKINMSEDVALVYPLLHDAETIVVSGQNYYHYCMRENSVCGGTKDDEKGIESLKQHFQSMLKQGKWKNPYKKIQYDINVAYGMAFAMPRLFFERDNQLFLPYENVNQSQKIILYGAGKFGQQLKKYLDRDGTYSVVVWADKSPKEGCVLIEEALKLEYDVILISIASAAPAEAAYKELIEKGVPAEKVRRISVEKIVAALQ